MSLIADRIAAIRNRTMGGSPSYASQGRPSSSGSSRDPRSRSSGGPVPGLPGVRFAPNISSGMQSAARSVAQWNSPDRMNHPAIGFSQGMAGINGVAGSAIAGITGDVEARLAEAGILRRPDGTWTIAGRPTPEGTVAQIARQIQPRATATGGNVALGDIPANTRMAIDVSGGTQTTPGGTVPGAAGTVSTPSIPPSSPPRTTPPPTPAVIPPAPVNGATQTLGRGQTVPGDVIGQGGPQPVANMATGGPPPAETEPLPTIQGGERIPPAPPAPAPTPGLGGVADPNQLPGLGMGAMGYASPQAIQNIQGVQPQTEVPPLGRGQTVQGGVIGEGSGAVDPNTPATAATPIQTLPIMQGGERLGPDGQPLPVIQGGQPIPPPQTAAPQPAPQPAPAPAPAPVTTPAPQTTPAPAQVATQVPPAPGPATTPTVPPGSLPGSTTPSRPGQVNFPAGFPFNDRSMGGAGDLSGLGDRISQMVRGTTSDIGRRATSAFGGGGLEGLGDRIAAMAQGGARQANPLGGDTGALGTAVSDIMGTVRSHLGQATQGQSPVSPNSTGGATPPVAPGQQAQGIVAPPGKVTGAAPASEFSGTIDQYANQFGVDPGVLHQMMMIESGGDPNAYRVSDGYGGGPAVGLMQVKPEIWEPVAQSLGLPSTYTPEGQIAMAAAILAGAPGTGGTPGDWRGNFLTNYFPADDPNGTTQGAYLAQLEAAQTGFSEPGGTGAPLTGAVGYAAPATNWKQEAQQYAPQTAPAALPAGTIQTTQWGNGVDWGNLTQYDATIQAEAAKHGIDPAMIYASMAIESGGANVPNAQGAPNRGVLQIWDGNAADAARLGYDITTTEGQIGYFAAIAAGEAGIGTGATPEERIMSVYPGAGGSPQHVAEYNADWRSIVDQYHTSSGAPAAAPVAAPPPFDPGAEGAQLAAAPFAPGAEGVSLAPYPNGNAPTTVTPDGEEAVLSVPGSGVTPANPVGLPTTSDGITPVAPINPDGKIPAATGVLEITTNADGMGIAATTASDDSWMMTEFGPNASISTYYKQPVTWSCGGCGQGCLYNYQCPEAGNGYFGVDASTHAAMDILCAPGDAGEGCRGSPVSTSTGGTVLCSGGQGEGNYVGCNFATSGEVVDNGGVGQISVNVGNDVNGNMIVMEYWHMETSNVAPGQVLDPGALLGGMGSMGGMVHTHLEAQGWCPECNGGQGAMVTLDPTLVADGYYSTHSPSEGYATEAHLGAVQTTTLATQTAPASGGLGAVQTNAPGYTAQPASSYQAAPAAMPLPSYYAVGTAPATTGQVTTDEAGRQYETMADGSLRLIYDPSW